MNKRSLFALLMPVAVSLSLLSVAPNSARGGTLELPIAVEIARHVTITATAMNFGKVVLGGTIDSDVTISPTTLNATGTNGTTVSGASAGRLMLSGDVGMLIHITIPTSASLTGTGDSIPVKNFKFQCSNASAQVPENGIHSFIMTGASSECAVGATISVKNSQAKGAYSGQVRIDFNSL